MKNKIWRIDLRAQEKSVEKVTWIMNNYKVIIEAIEEAYPIFKNCFVNSITNKDILLIATGYESDTYESPFMHIIFNDSDKLYSMQITCRANYKNINDENNDFIIHPHSNLGIDTVIQVDVKKKLNKKELVEKLLYSSNLY